MFLRAFSLIFACLFASAGEVPIEEILTEAKKAYPAVVFEVDLNNVSVTAEAHFDGEKKTVVVNQGLLDSKRLNADGFRMILCHEIGHLIGNDPRKSPAFDSTDPIAEDGFTFLSSEGQADFDSSRECFPKLLKTSTSGLRISRISPRLKAACTRSWGAGTLQYSVCVRSALGGENFLKLVKNFPISFETPDLSETESLIRDSYPDRQCRLDTILAGALKNAPRPKCWFK